MKRILASFILMAAAVSLSSCYYDPGYSYVRSSGYGGDAYYGQGAPTYYAAPGYYDGYYPGYSGYGYSGCCYAPGVSIGISSGWYGGSRDYRSHRQSEYRDYRGGRYRGHAPQQRSGTRPQAAPQQRSGARPQARPSSSHGGSRRGGEDRRSHSGDHRN